MKKGYKFKEGKHSKPDYEFNLDKFYFIIKDKMIKIFAKRIKQ